MRTHQYRFAALGAVLLTVAGLLSWPQSAQAQGYTPVNLTCDIEGVAHRSDPLLVNPWGITISATERIWISDGGTGVSTIYDLDGTPRPLVVTIPPPVGGVGPAKPTGQVFNQSPDFMVSGNGTSAPSLFIFATEDGTISGWNPVVNPTNAVIAVDRSGAGAIYKGIAMSRSGGSNYLYAADFYNGMVDQFDAQFNWVRSFTDSDPAIQTNGFAPFNVADVNGKLLVSFAKQLLPDKEDDEAGVGNGYVDLFRQDGTLWRRVASGGTLNSPWAMVMAPRRGFGKYSGALLVGNFGNGRINAFDTKTGKYLGQLAYRKGDPIAIKGLWGLLVAPSPHHDQDNDFNDMDVVYFTAGIADETHGLFGFIRVFRFGDVD